MQDTRPRPSRRVADLAAVTAVALATGCLALTGCGSDDASRTPATPGTSDVDLGIVSEGAHNRQDVAFAHDMIIHHRQTVALAGLAATRSTNGKLVALAQRIEQTQTPEIAQLSRWLAEWRQPVPAPSATPGYALPGLASATDVAALTSARGGDFDRRFVTLMTANHTGAISLSQDQLKSGADERVKGLAADIAASQDAELAELRKLLP